MSFKLNSRSCAWDKFKLHLLIQVLYIVRMQIVSIPIIKQHKKDTTTNEITPYTQISF